MAYKIGSLPSPQASMEELADYLEIQCILSDEKSFSIVEAAEDNNIVTEEDASDFLDDEIYQPFKDALLQIEERKKILQTRYPFSAELALISSAEDCGDKNGLIYTFLLFATRWNMGKKRIINGKDGSLIFERLCIEVLKNYFGGNSRGIIFGTGDENQDKSFKSKLHRMLENFVEKGYIIRDPDECRHNEKDAGVDLIVFTPFRDSRKGHFIAFGQCKTGTNWPGLLGQLNSRSFSQCYISPPLVFNPIHVYMISESFNDDWESRVSKTGGILFDRTRIMEYVPETIDPNILNDMYIWIEGIKKQITI